MAVIDQAETALANTLVAVIGGSRPQISPAQVLLYLA
jgi:hypothetical protein